MISRNTNDVLIPKESPEIIKYLETGTFRKEDAFFASSYRPDGKGFEW